MLNKYLLRNLLNDLKTYKNETLKEQAEILDSLLTSFETATPSMTETIDSIIAVILENIENDNLSTIYAHILSTEGNEEKKSMHMVEFITTFGIFTSQNTTDTFQPNAPPKISPIMLLALEEDDPVLNIKEFRHHYKSENFERYINRAETWFGEDYAPKTLIDDARNNKTKKALDALYDYWEELLKQEQNAVNDQSDDSPKAVISEKEFPITLTFHLTDFFDKDICRDILRRLPKDPFVLEYFSLPKKNIFSVHIVFKDQGAFTSFFNAYSEPVRYMLNEAGIITYGKIQQQELTSYLNTQQPVLYAYASSSTSQSASQADLGPDIHHPANHFTNDDSDFEKDTTSLTWHQ